MIGVRKIVSIYTNYFVGMITQATLILLVLLLNLKAFGQRQILEYNTDFNREIVIHRTLTHIVPEYFDPIIYPQFYSESARKEGVKDIVHVTHMSNAHRQYGVETYDNEGYISRIINFNIKNIDTQFVSIDSFHYDFSRSIIRLHRVLLGDYYCKEHIYKTYYFNADKLIDSIKVDLLTENCENPPSLFISYKYDSLKRMNRIIYTQGIDSRKFVIKHTVEEYSSLKLLARLNTFSWYGNPKYSKRIRKRLVRSLKNVKLNILEDSTNKCNVAIYINTPTISYYQQLCLDSIDSRINMQIIALYRWEKNGTMRSCEVADYIPLLNENRYKRLEKNIWNRLVVKDNYGQRVYCRIAYKNNLVHKIVYKRYTEIYYYYKQ